MIDFDEFQRWIRQAKHTLESSLRDLRDGDFDWACFKAHQAAEYALKALLRGLGRPAFGHSILSLMNEVKNEGLSVDSSLYRAARMLDRHYMAPRYPNQWAEGSPIDYYDRETAEDAVRCAESILEAVEGWLTLLKGEEGREPQ